jgi:hypothetical protein
MSNAFASGSAPRQLEGTAFEQVGDAAGLDIEHVQVGDPPHRQVAIPVAVLRLAGRVAGLLALAPFLVPAGLRLGAAQLGPDPRDERDAPAVRETT